MAKITLSNTTAGYASSVTTNANNTLVEAAIENTLSRDGTTPNTMGANLDMNSNKVVNLATGTNNTDAVTLAQMDAAIASGGGGGGGGGAASQAEDVTIADAGAYWAASEVEAALQEIGAKGYAQLGEDETITGDWTLPSDTTIVDGRGTDNLVGIRYPSERTVTANADILLTDAGHIIRCGAAGTMTLTMTTLQAGVTVIIKNVGGGVVTISEGGSGVLGFLDGGGANSAGDLSLAIAGVCTIHYTNVNFADIWGAGLS